MSIDATCITQTRARIVATANRMLAGDCSCIEGTRLICDLLNLARIDRFAPPFVTFVGIESETDDVPVGELREQWHPDAKIKLEKEWVEAERYASTYGEAACRDAIRWLIEHPFVETGSKGDVS